MDGFCFFAQKSLFNKIRFDDKTYPGFHLYDMDICMQVIEAGYKVCVCRDVLAEHCWSEKMQFSKMGGDMFAHNLELFVRVWQSRLPVWRGLDLPSEVFERVNELYRVAARKRDVNFLRIISTRLRKLFKR